MPVKAGALSALVPVTVEANPANRSSATINVNMASTLGTVIRRVGTLEVRGDDLASTRSGRVPGPPRVALVGDSITSNYTDYAKPVLEAEGYAVYEDVVAGSGLLDANECHGQEATSILTTQDPDVVVFDNVGNYGFFPKCTPSTSDPSTFYADWDAAAINDTDILTSKGASLYWLIGPGFPVAGYSYEDPVLDGFYLAIAASTKNVYTIDTLDPFGPTTANLALRAPDEEHLNPAGDTLMTSVVTSSIPAHVPGAPPSLAASAGNGSAQLSWGVPAWNGSAVTRYVIACYDATTSQWMAPTTASVSPATVSGLTNGHSYLFEVAASNSLGSGPASVDWNEVVPTTVPDPPTNVVASPPEPPGRGQLDQPRGQRQPDHRLHGHRHRHHQPGQRGSGGHRAGRPADGHRPDQR